MIVVVVVVEVVVVVVEVQIDSIILIGLVEILCDSPITKEFGVGHGGTILPCGGRPCTTLEHVLNYSVTPSISLLPFPRVGRYVNK